MLKLAAQIVVGPVVLMQARRVRARALDLPEPPGQRQGQAGRGEPLLRIVVVGDSSAAGVGAPSQSQGVAAHLARALAYQWDAAVAWQVVAQTGLTSPQALELLQASDIGPADIGITMLGVNDITKRVAQREAFAAKAAIARHLSERAGVAHTWLCALPEMECFPLLPQPLAWLAGERAREVNRAQARFAAQLAGVSHADMTGVMARELFSEDGFHPAPPLYARIAGRLAQHIATACDQGLAGRLPRPPAGVR